MAISDLSDSDLGQLAEVVRTSPVRTASTLAIMRAVKCEIVRRAMEQGGITYIHAMES